MKRENFVTLTLQPSCSLYDYNFLPPRAEAAVVFSEIGSFFLTFIQQLCTDRPLIQTSRDSIQSIECRCAAFAELHSACLLLSSLQCG